MTSGWGVLTSRRTFDLERGIHAAAHAPLAAWLVLAMPALATTGLRMAEMSAGRRLAGWYALALLSGAAAMALAIWHDSERAFRWLVVAAATVAVAVADYFLQFHDELRRAVLDSEHGWQEVALLAAAGVTAVIAVVVFLRFLRSLPARPARHIAAAVLITVGAGVGLDAVSPKVWKLAGGASISYRAFASGEELLEMLAFSLYLVAIAEIYAATRAAPSRDA
jgi:hypothetical protein